MATLVLDGAWTDVDAAVAAGYFLSVTNNENRQMLRRVTKPVRAKKDLAGLIKRAFSLIEAVKAAGYSADKEIAAVRNAFALATANHILTKAAILNSGRQDLDMSPQTMVDLWVMASAAYYLYDSPFMEDCAFDRLCTIMNLRYNEICKAELVTDYLPTREDLQAGTGMAVKKTPFIDDTMQAIKTILQERK